MISQDHLLFNNSLRFHLFRNLSASNQPSYSPSTRYYFIQKNMARPDGSPTGRAKAIISSNEHESSPFNNYTRLVCRDPGAILITDLNRNARQTNVFQAAMTWNLLRFARVPTVLQDINALALVCRKVFNHFLMPGVNSVSDGMKSVGGRTST